MPNSTRSPAHVRHRPLAAAIATLLAVIAPALHAADVVVTNCGDDDAVGVSLRTAVATAQEGDTVDASQLSCSTISLQTGAITVAQNDLAIAGPGRAALAIDGGGLDRVIVHAGSGTLDIGGVTLSNGYTSARVSTSSYVGGGCLLSFGALALDDVEVTGCQAHSTSNKYTATGGAILSVGALTIDNSIVSGNAANGDSLPASGGGIFAAGDLTLRSSEVRDNIALGAMLSGADGIGGGIAVVGHVTTIADSTIAGNSAGIGAGIAATGVSGSDPSIQFTLLDSTVSGNQARQSVGGVYVLFNAASSVQVLNSTITSNTAVTQAGINTPDAVSAGLALTSIDADTQVTLKSTLIAANTWGLAVESDLSAYNASIEGDHNLVHAPAAQVPADTLVGICPALGPLRSNGGPTRTHALLAGSPAIDAGSNDEDLDHDQRGAPYPRVSGVAADIGAFELYQGDAIFVDGFDLADDPCT